MTLRIAPGVLLLLGFAQSTCSGCCCLQRRPETPFSETDEGAAVLSQGIDPVRAREILAQASPRQLQQLRQLMFVADLQMASGNENNPQRLLQRVQRELAEPLVVEHNDVAQLVEQLQMTLRALPRAQDGTVILESSEGYRVVTRALEASTGAMPSTGDSLQRIMSFPSELAVAFLAQESVADHHYHDHNMRVAILRALSTGGAGARALPTYAQALRDERDSTYSMIFTEAADAARQVLGEEDFQAWYWEVQGRPFCRDER